MSLHFRPSLVSIALVGVVLTASRAEPLVLEPQEGVLLLRNGEVLFGKVTWTGQRYLLLVAGGEIRLDAAQVEHFGRDLDEAYRWKRSAVEEGNVQNHLDLAQWCIRHKLLGYAAKELRAALDADPNHPNIVGVERRLELARRQTAQPARKEPARQVPSNQELDRLVRGMPPGSVEMFTGTVQPLLLNHCTAAGCHGPRSTDRLRLMRVPPGKAPSRRLTQRNLHAILQFVDRAKPAASPLLTAPLRPHGGAKAAVFASRETAQYQQLAAWVAQVARPSARPRPASVERRSAPFEQSRSSGRPPAGQAAAAEEDESGAQAQTDPVAPPGDPGGSDPAPESPARGTPYVPVDPFDPEVFNRRFFPPNGPIEPDR